MNSPTSDAVPVMRDETAPARILVVDDQPANIQVVGSVLGKLGHEIIPASDGPTALRRLALRVPDLILLDLLMPEMDGCEVCRRVHANPEWKDIPVIFLSAADDNDFIVRAFEAGGVDYITKPFNQAELASRVRTQLALKSARDRLKQLAEDKDELLGILTHDLKSHLIGMQMSADVLRDRKGSLDEASITRLCENISRSGGQLLAFVKEFLANSAAEQGFTTKLEAVNLAEALWRFLRDQHRL
ncbi:MAG: response regulator, partial [Verrucomicrobiota bacterium]